MNAMTRLAIRACWHARANCKEASPARNAQEQRARSADVPGCRLARVQTCQVTKFPARSPKCQRVRGTPGVYLGICKHAVESRGNLLASRPLQHCCVYVHCFHIPPV